jgi:flagellar biosynthesis/type III secretory pathway protein FliH
VRIGYNNEMAQEAAKKVIRKQLEDQTEILHEKLDKLMNF